MVILTGQHDAMFGAFFKEFSLPKLTGNLEVGTGNHCAQIAAILSKHERFILENRPD